MNCKKLLLLLFLALVPILTHGQIIWGGERNKIGLKAGANNFDIHTGNFEIYSKPSWMAGFTARANYWDDFQLIYGLSFFDLNAEISGRKKQDDAVASERIQYHMSGFQGNFFGSYKIIENYLNIEAGPVIQLNGRFDPRQDKEFFYVEDYDIQAGDIADVSRVNFLMAGGISGGFERFKFFAQYQYGINNFFGGLDGESIEGLDPRATSISGSMNIIAAGVILFI